MIKLILSCLPVQMTYSLPSSSLIGKLMMLMKLWVRGGSAGAAQGCCPAYDTGSAHFIPSVEVKMLYMSVG